MEFVIHLSDGYSITFKRSDVFVVIRVKQNDETVAEIDTVTPDQITKMAALLS